MNTNDEPVTLTNIEDGAAIELFGIELNKVLENIMDPNTPATAVRTVKLIVKMKPDDSRSFVQYGIVCKAELPPDAPIRGSAFVGREPNGDVVAREINSKQGSFIDQEGAVIPLEERRES